jgi:PAS domain S-box-containing protein
VKPDSGQVAVAHPHVRLRVLVVEDSEDDALLIVRELERGGYEPVHERVDTPEAMRRALDEGGPWDVVLSDWQMPRFEAPEALAMFRAMGSEAPFIIVSGKVGEEAAVEAMKAGAHDYVMKGNLTRLCATVERGLEEAEARRERRRAEEERDRLFEFSPDLLGVAGLDGRFKRVNPAFEETLGYSTEELLAKPFIDFVHPEDRAATASELESLGRGARTAYFENRYLREDGSEVWLEWKAVLAVKDDLIYATARDITERKRAEEALMQSEERYRAVVEQAAEGIFLYEAATGDIMESNAAFQELLGYNNLELSSMQIYDFIAHERESIASNIRLMLDEKNRFVGERQYRRKDGSLVDVEASASLISYGERKVICAVIRNITDRKRSEEALRQSEQLYRTVIQQAAEYIYLVDAETRRLVGSNPAFREALGYAEEDLGHLTLYDIVAHSRENIDRNIRRVLERGRYFLGERKYRRIDGSLVDVETSSSTILYDGREVFCVVGHDITERRRKEEELRESQRVLSTLMSNLPGMAYRCRNDPDWTMELVSEGCFKLTGYPPGDLVGNRRKSYGDLIHLEDREYVWESVQAALGERRPFQLTYRITNASGDTKWVWEQGQGVFSPEGELLALEGFVIDTTERVRAFQMLEERVTALAGISASLTVDRPMETLLDALAASVVRASTARACSVVLIEEETYRLRTAGLHGLPDGYARALEESWQAGAHSFTVRAFDSQQPLFARDTRSQHLSDPLYAPAHRFIREISWDTVYIVPLVYRGRSLGAIIIYYMPEEEPEEDERVFLKAVADQTAVAVENARLFDEAQGKAALEERQRLARELHDSVSQALYGIALGSRTASTLLSRQAHPDRVAEWLEYVLSLAEAGLTEMRALIFELRPESLETEGLIAALKQQAAALEARHEIPVRANILCEEPDLPLETKEALYRIAQEALHNTVKHARATKAQMTLEHDSRVIALEVSDDGVGFDPEGTFSGHLGLKSMRERTARLGGTLRVESVSGKGTTIRVRIPSDT